MTELLRSSWWRCECNRNCRCGDPAETKKLQPPNRERCDDCGATNPRLAQILVVRGASAMWLKADGAAGDAYIQKDLALPDDFWVEFDAYVPTTTLEVLVSSFSALLFSADLEQNDGLDLHRISSGHIAREWDSWWEGDNWTFTPDAVQHIKYHYASGTVTWYLDGDEVSTYSDGLALGLDGVQFGAIFPDEETCEWYFVTNVKVGTADGGSDIFADDFSSGDFSAWSSTTGDVSLVSAPSLCTDTPLFSLDPESGCVGDTIRVVGTGYSPGEPITVSFGGSPVAFSQANVNGDGTIDGTFIVPTVGSGVDVSTPDDSYDRPFDVPTTFASSPLSGPHGTEITITGSCACPGGTITEFHYLLMTPTNGTSGNLVGELSNTTVDGDGNFSATWTVPDSIVNGDQISLHLTLDCDGTETTYSYIGYFNVCSRAPGSYEWIDNAGTPVGDGSYEIPMQGWDVGTVAGDLDGTPLDWTEHGDSYYVLTRRDPSECFGTTFPPPDLDTIYPLLVYRFPKDGSAPTTYPVGTDLGWSWGFDSKQDGTPGCFAPGCGVSCTPGRTGYWWRQTWWFAYWQKYVLTARLASDGETLWVGAIGFETEVYPWISTDDDDTQTCTSFGGDCTGEGDPVGVASQSDQFVDLATVTAGFTSFVTSPNAWVNYDCLNPLPTPSDYQKWGKWGTGVLGLGGHIGNDSDGGDNWTGYYQKPKLVMFAFDGDAFNRIGDIGYEYVVGYTGNDPYGGIRYEFTGVGLDYSTEVQIGALAMCASPAEPGVCQVVFAEQGAYGTKGVGGANANSPDGNYAIFDTGPQTIGARVNYSAWDSAGMSSEADLFTSSQDRADWFYVSDDGFGDLTNYSSQGPPDSVYADQFRLRNQHGSALLFLAFSHYEDRTSGDPDDHGGTVNSGHLYDRYASEGTVRCYDPSGPTLLDSVAPPLLPTLAEVQLVEPTATEAPNVLVALAMSDLGPDPSLDGDDNYNLVATWICYDATTLIADGGGMSVLRVIPDTGEFQLIRNDRTKAIAPNDTHPSLSDVPGDITDFAVNDNSVWMPGPDNFFIYSRLDLGPCDRWWGIVPLPSDSLFFGGNMKNLLVVSPPIIADGPADPALFYPATYGEDGYSASDRRSGIGLSTPYLVSCQCVGGLHVWQRF